MADKKDSVEFYPQPQFSVTVEKTSYIKITDKSQGASIHIDTNQAENIIEGLDEAIRHLRKFGVS